MCGGLSSHVVRVLLECDVRTPEHVRARKKHFLRARVLKKTNVNKPKHHRKKHKKRFWRSRLRAKQTSCCLFCSPVFCRRETSRRSSHLCFSEKKKDKTCKPTNFLFFVKMHRLCCARVISPQFLWGETIPSCAMGMCAPDAGGGVTGPDRQGVPLV